MKDSNQQFDDALTQCRGIFVPKLHDYGASWRIMRPSSVTDQIYIKAKRIRKLEGGGVSAVGEGILPEFMAIVNYAIIGIIQLQRGFADKADISPSQAQQAYDAVAAQARDLFIRKNHDYDEAWRSMRIMSYTDFILTKIERIKQIEDNAGVTSVSEGIDSNYLDILNYAVFGIIKMTE